MDQAIDVSSARTSALIVPRSDQSVFSVTGADRLTWLNGLVTCDLSKAKPGDAVYGLLLNKTGRIQTDLTLVILADRLRVVVPSSECAAVMASLEHYLVMEDVFVEVDPGAAVFAVHGPEADAVRRVAENAGIVSAPLDVTRLGGAIVLAEVGPEADAFVSGVTAQGRWRVGGEPEWEVLRLERGIPRFNADFDGTTYPQEAGLEKTAVSFSKGCYLGQEVVCMLELRGHVKRKLKVLELKSAVDVPARGASVLLADGAEVGVVTSTARGARGVLAFAMLKLSATSEATLQVGGAVATAFNESVV